MNLIPFFVQYRLMAINKLNIEQTSSEVLAVLLGALARAFGLLTELSFLPLASAITNLLSGPIILWLRCVKTSKHQGQKISR